MSNNHFTAILEVKESTTTEKDGGYQKPKIVDRAITEVAKIVLRADTLKGLQAKLAAHVALIEN
jgi:hypothetical protein